ncbi:hypothetical protein BKA58DRAFT_378221 [Alternaria rosae]|uniref:uncharacterized protein n=1 Tax=Alternaria rosae TaxID=1187941 RepID=UPI001E8DA598|nr:uncharacterized protein BKA58DRAFT_378221 [Alternaria rosae]KAH6878917.1 hypothetical protein BKA58DRAFT_378221 [Alternaria rosae]
MGKFLTETCPKSHPHILTTTAASRPDRVVLFLSCTNVLGLMLSASFAVAHTSHAFYFLCASLLHRLGLHDCHHSLLQLSIQFVGGTRKRRSARTTVASMRSQVFVLFGLIFRQRGNGLVYQFFRKPNMVAHTGVINGDCLLLGGHVVKLLVVSLFVANIS